MTNVLQTNMASLSDIDQVIYVYDVKGRADKQTATYPSRPWFLLPSWDEKHFKTSMEAALSKDVFRKRDVLCVLDGRRGDDVGQKMRRVMTAAAKDNAAVPKRALGAQVRLFYDNAEFCQGGYAHSSRARAVTMLPEPVESIHTVKGVDFEEMNRARKYLDLPGSTMTRGLAKLKLRTGEDHGIRLQQAAFEGIYNSMTAGVQDEAAKEAEKANKGTDEQSTGKEADGNETDAKITGTHAWYPWSSQEGVFLELVNMFGCENGDIRVVSFAPGFGQCELACIRLDKQCVSLVLNKVHREARVKAFVAGVVPRCTV